jgi:hypothetical protein
MRTRKLIPVFISNGFARINGAIKGKCGKCKRPVADGVTREKGWFNNCDSSCPLVEFCLREEEHLAATGREDDRRYIIALPPARRRRTRRAAGALN